METVRTKTDLIIEVWERLDCESIGRKEIEAIESAVRERFGPLIDGVAPLASADAFPRATFQPRARLCSPPCKRSMPLCQLPACSPMRVPSSATQS